MTRRLSNYVIALSVIIGVAGSLTAAVLGGSDSTAPRTSSVPDQSNLVTVAVTTQFAATAIPITVRSGDQFTLTLPSNPSTGYSWQMLNQPSSKVLKKTDSKYNEPDKPMPGKPGTETWTFRSVGKGKQNIEMAYLRPWEKGVTPARKQTFIVTVQ